MGSIGSLRAQNAAADISELIRRKVNKTIMRLIDPVDGMFFILARLNIRIDILFVTGIDRNHLNCQMI